MGSNIHGISCTANNYLKQAWNDIKNEYEKNQTYSITLFENTLVCFMRLYNELRRKVNEEDTPCLECESLEKEFEEMQNDNDLSLFMRTLRTNDTQIYSGVSGGITYTIQYVQNVDIVRVSLPGRGSESITDFKGYYWYGFMEYIENITACDDVFSEYCLDDENMSIQPEQINTPGISDLDSGIDLSGISFIQSEINKTYGLKYAPVDGDGYCLLRAILVLKEHEYSWALGSHKTQKQVYEEFIKIVDKQTIEALVDTAFYNLDAIISVGYRVNSVRATQFRQWCTFVLRQFAIRGYVLDHKRMENGAFLGVDYFEHLLAEIREIRLSERRFYQKLTDIYATAIDYNKDAPTTRLFFKKVQNKMHYAVHGHTAAELIVERANADKEHMGLTTWENAPNGKIVRTDVSVAKNYLLHVALLPALLFHDFLEVHNLE